VASSKLMTSRSTGKLMLPTYNKKETRMWRDWRTKRSQHVLSLISPKMEYAT